MVRWQGFSRLNNSGQPAPSAQLTVYLKGTNQLALLYAADDAAQPKGNPFTAGTDGYGFFYAANGRYDLVVSAAINGTLPTITSPYTLADLVLYDPGTIGS